MFAASGEKLVNQQDATNKSIVLSNPGFIDGIECSKFTLKFRARGSLVKNIGPIVSLWLDSNYVMSFEVGEEWQDYSLALNSGQWLISWTNDENDNSGDRNLFIKSLIIHVH